MDSLFPLETLEPGWGLAGNDEISWRAADDLQLLAAFRDGELAAFAELYRRHAPIVRAVCRSRLSDSDLAEEALQETFTRAFRQLPRLDAQVPVQRWLRRVAKNLCVDVLRRRRREQLGGPDGADVVFIEDVRAASGFERVESRAVLRSVLAPLSDRDRELLLAHHAAGVDVETLSQRWGMTKGSMAVALHRARTRARRGDTPVWGIGPVMWWWRNRRHALERLWFVPEQLGMSVQVVAAHLAVAVAVTASTALSAGAPTAPVEDARLLRAAAFSTAPTAVAVQGPLQSGSRPPATQPSTPSRSPSGPDSATATRTLTPVEVAPVDVPGSPLRVHQQRPATKPKVQVGVRSPVDSANPIVAAELHGEDDREFVAEEACTAAELTAPVTYCER